MTYYDLLLLSGLAIMAWQSWLVVTERRKAQKADMHAAAVEHLFRQFFTTLDNFCLQAVEIEADLRRKIQTAQCTFATPVEIASLQAHAARVHAVLEGIIGHGLWRRGDDRTSRMPWPVKQVLDP